MTHEPERPPVRVINGTIRALGIAIGTTLLATALAAPGPRATEVAEIVANIVATHPDGRQLAADAAFGTYAKSLEAAADDIDLADYVIRLHRLFSFVKDGHTAVLSLGMKAEPFTLRIPLSVEPFADGLYVIEAKDEAMPLLGGRLIAVNGTPIASILAAYLDGAQGDNRAWAMRWSPFLFAFPGWLHGLGFARGPYDSAIVFEVIDSSGRTVSAALQPRVGANANRTPLNRRLSLPERLAAEAGGPNYIRTLSGGKALYVSLDAMADTDKKSFSRFTAEIRNLMGDAESDRIIVDLRRNGGGNNMLAEPLRRSLVRSRFNRPGGIVVLIGPRTFSAAMNFATRLERETYAQFVGQPTGGRPNHFGDAALLTGSSTGLNYLVSTVRWQDSAPFDVRIWLLPDIPAPPVFADYLEGRDAALEAALSFEPTADPAADDFVGRPWERPSQRAGWQFFFEATQSSERTFDSRHAW